MSLPTHKTKIVCTIGPASGSKEIMEKMIRAGMDVARINFSHGDFSSHAKTINNLRAASKAAGKRLAIMADLPGPKMRIGQFAKEPIELKIGEFFTLTTDRITGDGNRVSVSFSGLPKAVRSGDRLFLNDGLIQLQVAAVKGANVRCRVLVGGELRSRKGLNLPGIHLGIQAFTEQDRRWLTFAKEQGLDALSQSFVENSADIASVRKAAADLNYHPFIIAKIERSRALDHIDEILKVSDGIMVARGDLGVEIPIERIAVVQKELIRRANLLGKPVITATQMLESMVENPRPTRAESTDVANAILDGTDCVMLSGESAMGKYPVEAVAMLGKISEGIEAHRPSYPLREGFENVRSGGRISLADLIVFSVDSTLDRISPAAVFVPTRSGYTARRIARFRRPVWITAVSPLESTCQALQFSSGVYPVLKKERPDDWRAYIRRWLRDHGVKGHLAVLTEGPSSKHPGASNRMEIIDLRRGSRKK